MDSGFYAACCGLMARSQALDLAANNLSNTNTSGFKAHRLQFRGQMAAVSGVPSDWLTTRLNRFGVMGAAGVDLSGGNLERTDNETDVAIEGPAFFAVQTAAGVRYTRNGSFHLSTTGTLVTESGDQVLGSDGAISLPSGPITISGDGTISSAGAVAARLQLVEFPDGTEIACEGGGYYSADQGGAAATHSVVRQAMLESSNVSPVKAAVNLIEVERSFEMLQRTMSIFHSEFNRIATDEIARV